MRVRGFRPVIDGSLRQQGTIIPLAIGFRINRYRLEHSEEQEIVGRNESLITTRVNHELRDPRVIEHID